MHCQIKSKYLGSWQPTLIDIDSVNEAFTITRNTKIKSLALADITRCQKTQSEEAGQYLQIELKQRVYEIRAHNQGLQRILDVFKLWKHFQNYKQISEQKLQKPKSLTYRSVIRSAATATTSKQLSPNHSQKSLRGDQQIQYEQYYRPSDWKRDVEEGGLLFINEQKKSNQPKIIKFLISKFLSTGSFMGISFPVFAMKAESILQSYCRCISLAPRLLTGLKNPIERIQAFSCLVITLSLRFTDLDKSFNPILGQTFQASVDGCQVFAEQVSHHPPISAFTLLGEDFKLHGYLQVQASMGFNSARGRFYGDLTLEYSDGGRIIGRLPCGILSGYLFGRYVFLPDGASYCYDPINHLVCSYALYDKDILKGHIGKLNNKARIQFHLLLSNQNEERRRERYEDFQHLTQAKFQKIYSRMEIIWTKSVSYDGKVYIDFDSQQWKPPKLSNKIPSVLLPSDSRNRKDIQLRSQDKIQQSQTQKERIQQQERVLQKLRKKYEESTHK